MQMQFGGSFLPYNEKNQMKFFSAFKKLFGVSNNTYVANHATFQEATHAIPQQVILQQGDWVQIEKNGFPAGQPLLVKGKIDTGGFGTVYIVEMNGETYALKILTLWLKLPKEWPDLIKRFESSFRAGQTNSNFIIKYYQKGYYRGNPCILMEYCPNGNLKECMEQYYEEAKWVPLAVNLLKGLRDLHASGVIHKDFKPENILFGADEQLRLTDFDFSAFLDKRNTITRGGRALDLWYTAIYSPPEQINPNEAFEKTGPAMDMFAFAVTMYQVITNGKLPWGSFEDYHKDQEGYYKKMNGGNFIPINVYRPDVPVDWAFNLERCLHPNPENRVQTPVDFLRSVHAYTIPNAIPNNPSKVADEDPVQEAAQAQEKWVLEIATGAANAGQTFLLEKHTEEESTTILIGRSRENDLIIDSIPNQQGLHHVSRGHATLIQKNGALKIRDGQGNDSNWKKSLNGTEVYNSFLGEHRRVTSEQFATIKEGDVINLAGEVTVKCYKQQTT